MSSNSALLLSSAYLAPIQYYCKLLGYEKVYIEYFENYSKQTYRNRCNILSANGTLGLTIPVKRGITDKILTKDVLLDNTSRWKQIHLRAIESAYRSSPFFIYYFDDLAKVYHQEFDLLVDFNNKLQETLLEMLQIKLNIIPTQRFKSIPEDYDDFSDVIHPKKMTSQSDKDFNPEKYYQVFGEKYDFIPNLSIIDLLFNMGPSAIDVLKESSKKI